MSLFSKDFFQFTGQRKGSPFKDMFSQMEGILTGKKPSEPVFDGFSLDKDIKGEIIFLELAPNESKVIPHGLRSIPQYRIILRQTGNAVITDVDADWTEKTIGLLNNSANAVVLTIKLLPG